MITSTSNPKVKRLVNLRKKRKARDEEGIFLVEGIRMFREVPEKHLLEVYVTEGFYKKEKKLTDRLCSAAGISPEVLSDTVFAYVSDTKTPQGVMCVVRQKNKMDEKWERTIEKAQEAPLFIVLDNLQDPGNMGTIIRTAEAAGVTGILMSADCVDVYNPKTIRSTMGSVYRMPLWYVKDICEAVKELKCLGIHTYAAHLEGKRSYDKPDYREGTAFLIGNEGNGLRREVAELADQYIRIPMKGQVESLNAAIAATILMFEAGRQRR